MFALLQAAASSLWHLDGSSPRWGWAAATALVMAGHLAAASAQLSEQDARISEFRQAASIAAAWAHTLPSAINLDSNVSEPTWRSLYHFASYAVVDRSASRSRPCSRFLKIGLVLAVRDLGANMTDAVPLADLRATWFCESDRLPGRSRPIRLYCCFPGRTRPVAGAAVRPTASRIILHLVRRG